MSQTPEDPIVEPDEGTPQPNPYLRDEPVQQETGESVDDPEGYVPGQGE